MDFSRIPFLTKFRPFRDRTDEVEILWYPARRDAPSLGYPSCVDVATWSDDPGIQWPEGAGSIQDAPRKFQNVHAKIAATGKHICGTREDFAEGCVYDLSLPPVIYTSTGLPKCCLMALDGNANGGGAATSQVQIVPVQPGEADGGGASRSKVTKFPPGAGMGTDCLTAGVAPVGGQQCDTLAFGDELWVEWSGVGAGTFTVTLSGLTDADVVLNARVGTCPGGLLVSPLAHVGGTLTWSGLKLAPGPVWVIVTGIGGAGAFCLTLTQP